MVLEGLGNLRGGRGFESRPPGEVRPRECESHDPIGSTPPGFGGGPAASPFVPSILILPLLIPRNQPLDRNLQYLGRRSIAALLNTGAPADALADAAALLADHPIGCGTRTAQGAHVRPVNDGHRASALQAAETLQEFNESLECPLPASN